jgi:hypothetical protein
MREYKERMQKQERNRRMREMIQASSDDSDLDESDRNYFKRASRDVQRVMNFDEYQLRMVELAS